MQLRQTIVIKNKVGAAGVLAAQYVSQQRLAQLPDVPTLQEALSNELAVQESWFGLWGPAGTPSDVVDTLHAAIVKTARTPSIEPAYRAAGNRATPTETPQAFAEFVREENRKWADIIKLAGVTVGG